MKYKDVLYIKNYKKRSPTTSRSRLSSANCINIIWTIIHFHLIAVNMQLSVQNVTFSSYLCIGIFFNVHYSIINTLFLKYAKLYLFLTMVGIILTTHRVCDVSKYLGMKDSMTVLLQIWNICTNTAILLYYYTYLKVCAFPPAITNL